MVARRKPNRVHVRTPPRSHTVCGAVHRRPADAKSCWYQPTRFPRLNGRRTAVQSSTPARRVYGFDRWTATRSRGLSSRESSRRKLPRFRRTADGSHTAPTARAGATRSTFDRFHRERDEHKISLDGGFAPRWRGDGKELFFLAPDGSMMAAEVDTPMNGFHAKVPSSYSRRVSSRTTTGRTASPATASDFCFLCGSIQAVLTR